MSTETNATETDQVVAALGSVLQSAREMKNLSIQEVAQRLKIPTQKITEMENDDLELKKQTVYERGYLRNYARMLDVDIGDFLSQEMSSKRFKYSQGEIKGAIDLPVYRHLRPKRRIAPLLFRWLVPALVVAACVSWWNQQSEHRSADIQLPTVLSQVASTPASPPTSTQPASTSGGYTVSRVTSGIAAGQ